MALSWKNLWPKFSKATDHEKLSLSPDPDTLAFDPSSKRYIGTTEVKAQVRNPSADSINHKYFEQGQEESSYLLVGTVTAQVMKAVRCPTDELSITNRAVVSPRDFDLANVKHVDVSPAPGIHYYLTLQAHDMPPGQIGFSMPQRKWMQLTLNQEIEVKPFSFHQGTQLVHSVTLEADFVSKKSTTAEPYNTDRMAAELLMQFPSQAVNVGQQMIFDFPERKKLVLRVLAIDVMEIKRGAGGLTSVPKQARIGQLAPNTSVTFEKADNSPLVLTGKAMGKQAQVNIIAPDWDFNKMGIGGLDREFSAIFRRAFTSRVFPPGLVEEMGMKHVRGILLYGPPGTGKTLMARQIGQMLNAREPKIVNGPSILDKYVGESEAKIRALFKEAEEEQARVGINSGLHIIIFDEIDSICKARGSMAGSSAVHDTVVNQLLAKLDGVEQLNNILVIGMTNRKDLIDEALIRPGRLEVQMEISLPDEAGRVQILNIHTCKIKEAGKLADDVSIEELAALTKNFSGAELEGLVKAAVSSAMYQHINADSRVELDGDAVDKLRVRRSDFMSALQNDCKPAFGTSNEDLEHLIPHGVLPWGEPVCRVLTDAKSSVAQVQTSDTPALVSLLLAGPPGCGKTALAAQVAQTSGIPFVKIVSPENMVGFNEPGKVQAIKKIFFDAHKSQLSCVIVDNLERLIDYVPIGPRFSSQVLSELMVLINQQPPKGKRLLVIATSTQRSLLQEMGLAQVFTNILQVSNLSTSEHLMTALEEMQSFSKDEMDSIGKATAGKKMWLPIKKLLTISGFANQFRGPLKIAKFLSALEEDGGLDMS